VPQSAALAQVELDVRPDRHFHCTHDDFEQHAEGRKELRNEYFHREMRRKLGVLMDGGNPVGGGTTTPRIA